MQESHEILACRECRIVSRLPPPVAGPGGDRDGYPAGRGVAGRGLPDAMGAVGVPRSRKACAWPASTGVAVTMERGVVGASPFKVRVPSGELVE